MNYVVAVDRLHVDVPGGAYMIAWQLGQLMRDGGHHVVMLCATPARRRAAVFCVKLAEWRGHQDCAVSLFEADDCSQGLHWE